MKLTNTYIGHPVERVEDNRFLRGCGRFTDDLSRPDQWHAAVVRSPVAHGRIVAVDTSHCLEMRGIHAVITARDLGESVPVIPFRRPNPTIAPFAQPVIAHERVRYAGEPVAVVLADSPERAQDGASAISLDIEPLPVVLDRQTALAAMMRLDETQVDYIEYDVGGGFGARGEFYPEDFLVGFAARRFGRPVKWTEDRREHFLSIAHSRETGCELAIAFDESGAIAGLRGEIYADIGAYVRPNGMTPVRNAAQFLSGAYRIPNIDVRSHGFVSNKVPSGTYRGPGRFESCFFLERLLQTATGQWGFDPLELRRRNLLRADEMPYRLASLEPNDGFGQTSCDSGDYVETFDRCLATFRWHDKARLNGQLVDGRLHGTGIACFIEGGGSGPREHVKISACQNGQFRVAAGSSAVGQGIETIFAQIAADALEMPISRIQVQHGSTTLLKEGFGSYGSRSTVMGGSAVVSAAEKLLGDFRVAAARWLDVSPAALLIGEGVARSPDGREISIFDLCLEAEASFSNGSKATYSYGTAAVHVAVDPDTGHTEILDYTVCDDVGRIINPHTLHGQVIGAAVQGLGSVFSEELRYDAAGQCITASLADYLLPVATDYPHLHAISLQNHPSPNNPLGAKGAGEGGIIPVGAAVANAVANAIGVPVGELPLTPQRLWLLMARASAS